jgi:hypothetical protein
VTDAVPVPSAADVNVAVEKSGTNVKSPPPALVVVHLAVAGASAQLVPRIEYFDPLARTPLPLAPSEALNVIVFVSPFR